MRKLSALIMVLILLLCLSGNAMAAADKITTTATGYTCAEDVEHKIIDGIVVNWGARGETCSFLSPSAQNYYSARDTETWETLSEKDGGTSISDAYTSELYKALQSLMQTRHTKKTSYGETRDLYCYTDCLLGDYEHISSFYSGKIISGAWDRGATWNREHTWPSSKTPSGKPKNDTVSEATDIMTLRPTATSENSSRGNTAFGESRDYYDPGESVRGDCARVVLYGYVRWGNTGKMWGSAGVMESLDILLKWMEEDPVDTWEMGRNDSVQSITGVRNVFVDYPEFAWMLFGRDVPAEMTTPSGNADNIGPHTHSYTSTITTAATCTAGGIMTCTCTCGDSYTETIPATGHSHEAVVTAPTCTDRGFTTYTCACGDSYISDWSQAAGHTDADQNWNCDICNEALCGHDVTAVYNYQDAACTASGYTGDTHCANCGLLLTAGTVIPATGHNDADRNWVCDSCGETLSCPHENVESRDASEPSCSENGKTGEMYCVDCGKLLAHGSVIPATGIHSFGDWTLSEDGKKQTRTCSDCGRRESRAVTTSPLLPTEPSATPADDQSGNGWIIAVLAATAAGGVVTFLILKKKKH